jgi:hypothetical protein
MSPLHWTSGHLTWKSGHLAWCVPTPTAGCASCDDTALTAKTATVTISGVTADSDMCANGTCANYWNNSFILPLTSYGGLSGGAYTCQWRFTGAIATCSYSFNDPCCPACSSTPGTICLPCNVGPFPGNTNCPSCLGGQECLYTQVNVYVTLSITYNPTANQRAFSIIVGENQSLTEDTSTFTDAGTAGNGQFQCTDGTTHTVPFASQINSGFGSPSCHFSAATATFSIT